MANRISEELFKAIDVIVGQRLRNVSKDLTILCTIEDNTNADKGIYTVSNEEARFEAVCENPDYRIGQNVWVLVPEGNYDQDKIIIGKYTKNTTTPYIWVDPLHTYADITGNVLTNALSFEDGIIANYTHPIDIFSGEVYNFTPDGERDQPTTIGDLITYWMSWLDSDDYEHSPFTQIGVVEESDNEEGQNTLGGFTQLGISADFRTAFGDTQPIKGDYGLLLLLKTRIQTGVDEYDYRPVPFMIDTEDMWGDPYNYGGYSTQSMAYEIDPVLNGTPVAVAGVFYQLNNFEDGNEEPIPYEYEGELLNPNIFMKNVYLSFGYNINQVDDDTVYLFTKNNLSYIVNNDSSTDEAYAKQLEARFIYVSDDTRIAINGMGDLQEKFEEIPSLLELMPIIRWYRFRQNEGVEDIRAGEFWEEFYTTSADEVNFNWFLATVNDLKDSFQEQFKCILCYNPKFIYYLRSYLFALITESATSSSIYRYWNRIWTWAFQQASDWESVPAVNTPEREQFDKDFPYDENVRLPLDDENRVTSDMILERWAKSDQMISSEVLTFTNTSDPFGTTRDLIQGLRLTANDSSNGIFNAYESTFGANNMLINMNDERIPRSIKATFLSAVTGNESMDEVERITWYVPKNNTMIKKPEEGVSFHTYTKVNLTEENFVVSDDPVYYTRDGSDYLPLESDATFDDETVYYILTQEKLANDILDNNNLGVQDKCTALGITLDEYNYFMENNRAKDFYIIIDDQVQSTAKYTKEATMTYFIKPGLRKTWTNNTIYASAYRFGRVYDGDLAKFTPLFGAKGTNGTSYTLSLSIVSEMAQASAESVETEIAYPPAWTLPSSGDSVTKATKSMQLEALLFDKDDIDITDKAKFTWTIMAPSIGLNTATTATDSTSWTQDAYLSNRTSSGQYNGSKPIMRTWVSTHGWILKCEANVNDGSGLRLSGYLIIPTRKSRKWIGMEGPAVIRYNSSGTNPIFYDSALGLIDIDGEIDYNTNGSIAVRTLYETVTGGRTNPNPFTFDGTNIGNNYNAEGHVISETSSNTGTALSYLKNYYPTCVLNVDDNHMHLRPKAMYYHDVVYSLYIWFQYPNGLHWSQPILVLVDPYGNKLLNNWGGALTIDYDNNSVMSAIMGAGKKETDNTFTGLLMGDLPHVDNGISRSGMVGYDHGDAYYQLYDNGTITLGKSGVAQLKFDGNIGYIQNHGYTLTNSPRGIKIDFVGNTTSGQYPSIDAKGSNGARVWIGTNSNFLMVKAPDVGTTTGNNLLYVGTNTQYIQTADYVANTSGARLDLKNANFISNGSLTIRGGASTATDGFIYLSTSNRSDTVAGTTTTNWRLIVGNQFGVTASGKLYTSGATIGGSSTVGDDSVIGGRTIAQLKTQADTAGLTVAQVANSEYIKELQSKKIGGWNIWHTNIETTTITQNNGTVTVSTTTASAPLAQRYFGLAHVDNNGALTHFMGSDLSGTTYKFGGNTVPTTLDGNSNAFWTLYMNGNFGVTTEGKLYAKGAYIDGSGVFTGTIYANSGTFSGTVYASDGEFTGTVHANDGNIEGLTVGDLKLDTGSGVLSVQWYSEDVVTYISNLQVSAHTTEYTTGISAITGMITSSQQSPTNGVSLSRGDGSWINVYPRSYYTRNLIDKITVSLSLGRSRIYILGSSGSSAYSAGASDSVDIAITSDAGDNTGGGGSGGGSGGDDPGTGTGCLAKGTKIIMYNNIVKNIEDIKIGELVIAYDEITNAFVPKRVLNAYYHRNTPTMMKVSFYDGTNLVITPGHPILTTQGWRSRDIRNSLIEHATLTSWLEIGDNVITTNGNKIITNIQNIVVPDNYISYNIEVQDCHTFVANNVVVHNLKPVHVKD